MSGVENNPNYFQSSESVSTHFPDQRDVHFHSTNPDSIQFSQHPSTNTQEVHSREMCLAILTAFAIEDQIIQQQHRSYSLFKVSKQRAINQVQRFEIMCGSD
eukprot:317600_1